MGFKVVRIDEVDNEKFPIATGSHYIGRGTLLNCNDRNIATKHGVICVTEDTIRLTSVHPNLCYYKRKNIGEPQEILLNQTITLGNGDSFGLLPYKFWYEIIYSIQRIDCQQWAPSYQHELCRKSIMEGSPPQQPNELFVPPEEACTSQWKQEICEKAATKRECENKEDDESDAPKKVKRDEANEPKNPEEQAADDQKVMDKAVPSPPEVDDDEPAEELVEGRRARPLRQYGGRNRRALYVAPYTFLRVFGEALEELFHEPDEQEPEAPVDDIPLPQAGGCVRAFRLIRDTIGMFHHLYRVRRPGDRAAARRPQLHDAVRRPYNEDNEVRIQYRGGRPRLLLEIGISCWRGHAVNDGEEFCAEVRQWIDFLNPQYNDRGQLQRHVFADDSDNSSASSVDIDYEF